MPEEREEIKWLEQQDTNKKRTQFLANNKIENSPTKRTSHVSTEQQKTSSTASKLLRYYVKTDDGENPPKLYFLIYLTWLAGFEPDLYNELKSDPDGKRNKCLFKITLLENYPNEEKKPESEREFEIKKTDLVSSLHIRKNIPEQQKGGDSEKKKKIGEITLPEPPSGEKTFYLQVDHTLLDQQFTKLFMITTKRGGGSLKVEMKVIETPKL